MKHRLSFKGPELEKLLVWARNNDAVYPYTNEPVMNHEQGLWLVKDDGIYLMSASNSDGKGLKKADGKPVVTYARGYDPKYEDDLWDKTYAVSRDDFAEFIPIGQVLDETYGKELKYLDIIVSEETLEVAWMVKQGEE
tara:strand:+ start:229 stop:642 length:414 start_codon:yes stop_codon:yes gene_type:complete